MEDCIEGVCRYPVPRRGSARVSPQFKPNQGSFQTRYGRADGGWVGPNDGEVFHVDIQGIAKQFYIDNLRK